MKARGNMIGKTCNDITSSGNAPESWRHTSITYIWKGKGKETECGNYRPISCNDLEYKWYTQILLPRNQRALEPQRMDIQLGFLPNCGIHHCTTGIKALDDELRKRRKHLHIAFLDLSQAYDSVNRTKLFEVLRIL